MRNQICSILLISLLTACSSPMEQRQANGNDSYLNAAATADLVIPENLRTPQYRHDYDIPAIGSKVDLNLVGKKLDIRPPLQILPLAEGTQIKQSANDITVEVESIDNQKDLKQEIFDYLTEFLQAKKIAITDSDLESGIIDTNWISYQEVIEAPFWGADKIYRLKQRYQFDVQVEPNARLGTVSIKLLAHEESYNGNKQDIQLTANDKHRYTVDMLNSAISYLSFKREQLNQAKRIAQSSGIPLLLEQEKDVYYQADATFDKVWQRLRIVLPEVGFSIVDMDRSKQIMFVSYEKEQGFWDKLFGDNTPVVEEGEYRIQLSPISADATKLQLLTKENEPLDSEVVKGLYPSFAKLMAENRETI